MKPRKNFIISHLRLAGPFVLPDKTTHLDGRFHLILRLRLTGYEVIEAKDGLEALDKASKDGPDLILMDMQLPKPDGCENFPLAFID